MCFVAAYLPNIFLGSRGFTLLIVVPFFLYKNIIIIIFITKNRFSRPVATIQKTHMRLWFFDGATRT